MEMEEVYIIYTKVDRLSKNYIYEIVRPPSLTKNVDHVLVVALINHAISLYNYIPFYFLELIY